MDQGAVARALSLNPVCDPRASWRLQLPSPAFARLQTEVLESESLRVRIVDLNFGLQLSVSSGTSSGAFDRFDMERC